MDHSLLVPTYFSCVASQIYQSNPLQATPTPSNPNKPPNWLASRKNRPCLKQAQLAGQAPRTRFAPTAAHGSAGRQVPLFPKNHRRKDHTGVTTQPAPPPTALRWACFKSCDTKEVFLSLAGFLEEKSPPAQAFRIPTSFQLPLGSRSGAAARAADAGHAPCIPVGRAGRVSPSPCPLHKGIFFSPGAAFLVHGGELKLSC